MSWKDILKNDRLQNAMNRVDATRRGKKDKYVPVPKDKNMKERYNRLSRKPSYDPATEKAHCGSEKLDDKEPFEKKLIGNQKKIDANKDGKITGEDFRMLSEKKAKVKCPQCKGKGCAHCDDKGYHISKGHKSDSQIEKEILAEIKKEGGALGMKNLKPICPSDDLERVLNSMKKKGTIFMHEDGDIYTHKPSRGRGFTR